MRDADPYDAEALQTPRRMKTADGKKLDQIIAMLGDVVDAFGQRFDKIERDMPTKDQVLALETQVNSIEQQLRETRIEVRLGGLEEKVFGAVSR
jgi:hypothetical protein